MSMFFEKAQEAWNTPPDWILALAQACDQSSQRRVAERLSVSTSYLSWALGNQKQKYHPGVEDVVRARLMDERIACPVLGEIAPDLCRRHRREKRRAQGPVQRQLRETCPECPLNPEREASADE